MKKTIFTYILCFLLIFTSCINVISVNAASNYYKEAVISDSVPASPSDAMFSDAPDITSSAAIVMDINTGSILYQKDAYSKYYPASITKVMTALLALEHGNLQDIITMSDTAVWGIDRESSHISLDVGEKLTLKDALYGMMLKSANEASLAIAEYVGTTQENFSSMMNEKAATLGCKNTHFSNANGLHDDNHYTCAYDMALIGKAAYSIAEFRTIISTKTYTIPATNKNVARDLTQNDDMIFPDSKYYYEFCTGGKTGYTKNANGTLLSFAEKDGMQLICVTLDAVPSSESFYDTIKLFDYCFDNYSYYYPLDNFSFSGNNSGVSSILSNYYTGLNHHMPNYTFDKDFRIIKKNSISPDTLTWEFNYLPVPNENLAGTIKFLYKDNYLGETNIYVDNYLPESIKVSSENINKKENNHSFIIKLIVIFIFLIIIAAVYLRIIYVKKQRQRKRRRRKSSPIYPINRY